VVAKQEEQINDKEGEKKVRKWKIKRDYEKI
jgi:hypothetical protein